MCVWICVCWGGVSKGPQLCGRVGFKRFRGHQCGNPLRFHLRISVASGTFCSATTPASGLWRRSAWLRLRGWALKPALLDLSLSPCRGGRGCSGSGWEGKGRRCSTPEGDGVREEQRLRLSHKAPQFCSHCSRTLLVNASFTSSPQLRRIFTSSTYGLGTEKQIWSPLFHFSNTLTSKKLKELLGWY